MDNYKNHKDFFFESYFLKMDFLLHLINSKKYRVARHIFSLVLFAFCLAIVKKWERYQGIYDYLDFAFYFGMIVLLFYINMYILIPRVLFNGKSLYYFILYVICILIAVLIAVYFEDMVLEPRRTILGIQLTAKDTFARYFLNIMWTCILIFFSTALKFFQRWVNDTEKMIHLKRDAVTSELVALRNQINPHFLFNMLNNINVLAKINSPRVSPLIEQFSDFLRYLIYDSDQSFVSLAKEVKFVRDYLELENVRRDEFTYQVIFDEDEIRFQGIPPNIVLILVENAIKHSVDPVGATFVYVNFHLTDEHIFVQVSNSVSNHRHLKETPKGIGLLNLNRRLELLYGSNYELTLSEKANVFTADLTLPLTKGI